MKTTALTPDGVQRPFHPGHINNGRRQGYVYVGRARVYGSINLSCEGQLAVFEPTGKNAGLVQGTFHLVESVDVVIDESVDALGALEDLLLQAERTFDLANID